MKIFLIIFFITYNNSYSVAKSSFGLTPADTSAHQNKNSSSNTLHSNQTLKLKYSLNTAGNKITLAGLHSSSNNYNPLKTRTVKTPLSYKVKELPEKNTILKYQLADGTYWRTQTDLKYARFLSIMGGIAMIDLFAFNQLRHIWDQENMTKMHSMNWWNDVHNYQRMDKIGHFTDAYFVSDLTSKLYRWSGISGTESVWYGALTGWLWMLQIEISDGFFADWGFSWLDLSANTLGSGFFVLQHYFPEVLGGLHPKISYNVSSKWKNNLYEKTPKAFIDDYEGITFWMAINPYHYFPDSWKRGFPKWLAPLGIAVGYGAEGIAENPQFGRPQWYVGLDIDLRKIPIGNESGFFKFIKSELNFIRLPLPTIRFTPSGIWYGFYF